MNKFIKETWSVIKLKSCQVINTASGSRITAIPDHFEYEGKVCGSISSQDKTQKELDQIACLISAAPDMYAAIYWVMVFIESGESLQIDSVGYDDLLKSMHKAEGKQ